MIRKIGLNVEHSAANSRVLRGRVLAGSLTNPN